MKKFIGYYGKEKQMEHAEKKLNDYGTVPSGLFHIDAEELQSSIILWAKEKGWLDKEVSVAEQCALIHSEISEALESYRNNEETLWLDENGKPNGLASEYADAAIRLFHYAYLNEFDLITEIRRKMEYNWTRPHRHGGKKI